MKNILLTGSSGGLGLSLTKELLKHDYFIILNYFKNAKEVEKIHEKYPKQTFLLQGDISNEQEVIKMSYKLKKNNLKIEILINNAAIENVSELEEKTEETFINIFKVNTLGAFYLIKHFGKEIDEKKGHILNISSDNTIDMYDIVTLEYDISKSGLNIMTKAFSAYFKNAKVNALAFGWLDTPMNKFPNSIKEMINFLPIKTATDKILDFIETKETGKIEVVR